MWSHIINVYMHRFVCVCSFLICTQYQISITECYFTQRTKPYYVHTFFMVLQTSCDLILQYHRWLWITLVRKNHKCLNNICDPTWEIGLMCNKIWLFFELWSLVTLCLNIIYQLMKLWQQLIQIARSLAM